MSERFPKEPLYWIVRNLLLLGLVLWNRITVRGRQHVPQEGGCIVASNHISFLDPPALGATVPGRVVRYLARDTLFRNPLFGRFLRNVGAIPLDRTKGDLGALRKALSLLKEGKLLGLFPEGTRSLDGKLQPPKGGVGFIMGKSGVPVVPAYIDGTYRAYPKGGKWIRPYKVRVFYGPPILPDEIADALGDDKDYKKIGELVMDRIASLRPDDAVNP